MVHEDNPNTIWSHNVKSTISKVRTMANAISLVESGHYSISELKRIEKNLWEIAKDLDNHCNELFTEIERLTPDEDKKGRKTSSKSEKTSLARGKK